MRECFHCGAMAVVWECDFSFEEYGDYDGDGIYQLCHCDNCGADITYRVPFRHSSEEDDSE